MQLYSDDYFDLSHDPQADAVVLTWTDRTSAMSDDDFKEALVLFVGFAAEHKVGNLLVDVRSFGHPMTPALAEWRAGRMVPRYNRTGMRKFAYVVGPAFPVEASNGEKVETYDGEDFATSFFDADDKARAWFAAN